MTHKLKSINTFSDGWHAQAWCECGHCEQTWNEDELLAIVNAANDIERHREEHTK